MFGVVEMKYKFKNEKARNDFLIEEVLICIKKVKSGELFWRGGFERDCDKNGWVALSLIKRNLMRSKKGLKFCNALSDLENNDDKEERLIELIEKMEKMQYFRFGGQFNKKYYLYRISKNLELKN
jgi:hypothetical protein